MNIKKTIALGLVALFNGGPGSLAQLSEMRELPPFTKISIQSIADVMLRQEPVQKVEVSGGNAAIETRVNNGTLYIDGGPGTVAQISMPVVEGLTISGKGSITGENQIKGKSLEMNINGDGKVSLDVDMEEVSANISGLGKISLSGKANEASFNVSGSGKVDALEMQVNKCKANISGLGKCSVDVKDELESNISGFGKVSYKTKPAVVRENITGRGKTGESNGDSLSIAKDTTHLSLGNVDILVISKENKKDKKEKRTEPIWAGLELGVNSYMNADNKFEVPEGYSGLDLKQEKSISVALNLFQKNFEIAKSNVWFYTGLGISWNNYRFDNNVSLLNTTPISTYTDTSADRSYSKSKLTASYLTAPLMFQVFTSRDPRKAFHISAGAMLGLRLGSHTKMKYEEDGRTYKPKSYDDFNLNPFRYGFRAAIGYGKFQVFADYYASTLFRDKKGPSLYPVNAGITLVGF